MLWQLLAVSRGREGWLAVRLTDYLTVQLVPECLQGFLDSVLTNATDGEISGRSGDCQKYIMPQISWQADSSAACYRCSCPRMRS